ncbi:MAG TPA: YdcF family protein [Stellaceae bacterium]|nr:YdcF family protein [Stellaceae bacterium]
MFILSKLAWWLMAPSDLLLCCLLTGVILGATRRWRRLGTALAATAAIVLAMVLILPVPAWLTLPLENRFPQGPAPAVVDGIVMLGGGQLPALSEARGQPTFGHAEGRLIATVALMRAFPRARIVIAGGNGEPFPDTLMTEADVTRGVLAEIGIDPAPITFEDKSRNTWENANFTRTLMQPKPGETWLLVTSALHMPRSVGIFRRVGWPVVPWPVDYTTRPDGGGSHVAQVSERLTQLDAAAREWVGLAAYRVLGYTADLLPAPSSR